MENSKRVSFPPVNAYVIMKLVENTPRQATAAMPEVRRTIRPRWLFSVLRLLFFIGIMIFAVVLTAPLKDLSVLAHPWVIGGAVASAALLGMFIYLLHAPENPLASSALDFEAIGIVAVSTIIILFLGILSLLTAVESNIMLLGLVFTGIYTFYIYRTLREIMRVRRDYEEIRGKYGELIEIDREKSDFITVTSHQLRTPLTEVRWALETILGNNDHNPNSKITSVIQKSIMSVNSLIKIIDDMVKAQIFESVADSFEKHPLDIALLIQNINDERDLLAQAREVTIAFSPPERKIFIDANKEKIKIAFENIIDNAIRYSPRGNVYMALDREGDRARIRIQDTGIGIAKEDFGRIFTKFFRGQNAMLSQPSGSGIGLYASKSIIQRHGGTIDFLSEVNKGTTFIITFPLSRER